MRGSIAAILLGVLACSHSEEDVRRAEAQWALEHAGQSAYHADSAPGEVAQYALMHKPAVWLTDSSIVALAAIVTAGPAAIARAEALQWSSQQAHDLALEIIRDHVAFQATLDSLVAAQHITVQRPALADAIQARYDSLVATVAAGPSAQFEQRFLDAEIAAHSAALADLAGLGGNTTNTDLRALLTSRARSMEQVHLARARAADSTGH